MRKVLLVLAMLIAFLFCTPATAEIYIIDELLSRIEIPDNYIVLTEKNLSNCK